jgi:hypothetical protein
MPSPITFRASRRQKEGGSAPGGKDVGGKLLRNIDPSLLSVAPAS